MAQTAILLPTKYGDLYEIGYHAGGGRYQSILSYGVMTRKHGLAMIETLFGKRAATAARKTADACELK